MILAHKIELKPNNKQITYFKKACGISRLAWNWGLAKWEEYYKQGKKVDGMMLKKEFNSIKKKDFPFVYEVTKYASQQPFIQLNEAYKRFFKGTSKRPKFKKKNKTIDSFYIGGDQIKIKDKIIIKRNSSNKKNFETKVPIKDKNIIRVLKGPQFDYFSKESQKDFFSKDYKITNLTDRMGMRLEGTTIKNTVSTNIRSEGITKGAIQVPAGGQPIVLLTDYPTIGGYPKIANVISADYHLLAQKIPDEKILFQNVELQEAEQLYKEHLNSISEVIKNIKEIN